MEKGTDLRGPQGERSGWTALDALGRLAEVGRLVGAPEVEAVLGRRLWELSIRER